MKLVLTLCVFLMVVGGGLNAVNAAEDELPDITTSSLEDGK